MLVSLVALAGAAGAVGEQVVAFEKGQPFLGCQTSAVDSFIEWFVAKHVFGDLAELEMDYMRWRSGGLTETTLWSRNITSVDSDANPCATARRWNNSRPCRSAWPRWK